MTQIAALPLWWLVLQSSLDPSKKESLGNFVPLWNAKIEGVAVQLRNTIKKSQSQTPPAPPSAEDLL